MDRFEEAYKGTPPWDIGRPQSAVVRLEREGRIQGRVLDSGCGTGENALYLAGKGHEVVGVDLSRTAIAKARRKAAERGVEARFIVLDALRLGDLGTKFDTVIDSGLFHVFTDEQRARYVGELARVVRTGGLYHMLVWSDREPGTFGPRRVARGEIEGSFRKGWSVEAIDDACFETTFSDECVLAWLGTVKRV